MRLHDIHKAADEAGIKAAEKCPSTPQNMGFVFIKFPANTAWGLWTKSRGLSIRTSRHEQVMMIRRYNSSMPRQIAYAHAYAEFLKSKRIKVDVRIDQGTE